MDRAERGARGLWAWFRIPIALFLLTLLAVISWAAASVGFSFYLANFANYSVIYGRLGIAIALLTYLYLSAVAFLLGGEVNAAIYRGATESEIQGPRV
ncbi:MAG: YihY/virulence factor BrkB family protein [Rubrobacter sp.]|nr:YihY/virulence factor BrkB family protein [Rubrobacter sp.]